MTNNPLCLLRNYWYSFTLSVCNRKWFCQLQWSLATTRHNSIRYVKRPKHYTRRTFYTLHAVIYSNVCECRAPWNKWLNSSLSFHRHSNHTNTHTKTQTFLLRRQLNKYLWKRMMDLFKIKSLFIVNWIDCLVFTSYCVLKLNTISYAVSH